MAKNKGTQVSMQNQWDDLDDFETVSTGGFPPMWKPSKDGESIYIRPMVTKLMSGKKIKNPNSSVECILLGDKSGSFFQGEKKVTVPLNSTISLGLSYNLVGEDRVAVYTDEESGEARLSNLSQLLLEDSKGMIITFDGKVKGKGGRSVKTFTIMAPKGYKERVLTGVDTETKHLTKKRKRK